MKIKQLLGVLYPETGKMQTLTYTFQYDKSQCESEGYTWYGGYCFEVLKENLKEINIKAEYIGGGRLIYSIYAILEVE